MLQPVPRRLLVAGAFGAAAVMLAGCGGSSDPLGSALKATNSTLSQNSVATFSLTSVRAGEAAGRAGYGFPQALAYQILHTKAGPAYFIFTPTTVFVDPVDRSALAATTTWVSVPVATAPGPLAATVEGLNAQLPLEEVAWGSVSAVSLGQKVVQHVPYAAYAVTVDLRRAIAHAHGPAAAALTAAMRAELAAGGPHVRVDEWVDGPGRVAQVAGEIPGSGLGVVTTTLSAFGVKIASNPPAAAQVVALGSVHELVGNGWVLGSS